MEKSLAQSLSIRQARPDEVLQILRIQIDALRILCVQDYSSDQIEALVDRNIQHFSRGGYRGATTFIAELEKVRVGVSSLLGNRISAVYVHPLYIRQGIGSQLLQAVEQAALSRNIKTLNITASLTACPFYQAWGYQVIDHSHLVTKDGLRIRCKEMRRHLVS